ncbi:MAG: pilus (MSHA type) biogenesis protein MshL [Granulosicoccaceae bacterium]
MEETQVPVDLPRPESQPKFPSAIPKAVLPQAQELYSLRVKDAPFVEVFRSLAARANLDLSLHIQPKNTVDLELREQPLHRVLDALIATCECDYSLAGGRLSLFADRALSRRYSLDYLNIQRTLEAQLGLATRVGNLSFSNAAERNGSNTSNAEVSTESSLDVWQSVDAGLRGLLQLKPDDTAVQVNPAAGLVVVHARREQQQLAADYLADMQARIMRQVSIEAQVIEVELNENHATGVDWSEVAKNEGYSWLQTMSTGFVQAVQQGGASLQYTGSNSSTDTRVLVNLLQQYGDVRVISSPRVVALNNQPSVLSVVENKVYFSSSVKINSSTDASTTTESVETAIHTVPVGLVMQVTPQIATSGDVVMNIRPTISRVSGYVSDPNPNLAKAGVVSLIPEIQVRELETVLRVRDGETIVLGGMMQVRHSSDRQNVPWLHKLPALGGLFRSRQKSANQAELLVLLTPTLMPVGVQP